MRRRNREQWERIMIVLEVEMEDTSKKATFKWRSGE